MPTGNLDRAAASLSHALGLAVSSKAIKIRHIRHLAKNLHGSGYSLVQMPISSGILSAIEGTQGILVPTSDGRNWTPATVVGTVIYSIENDGTQGEYLPAKILQDANHCWAIVKNREHGSRYFSFMRRHKGPLLEVLACGLLINLFALVLPLFSSFVYDKVLGNGITETLWALAISIFCVQALDFLVRTLRVKAAEHFAYASETEIDYNVMNRLLSTETGALPSIGSLLDRYKQILARRDIFSSTFLSAIADIPYLLLFLFAIALASGPLVLVPLLMGILSVLLNAATIRPTIEYDNKSRSADARRFEILSDVLETHEVLLGKKIRNALFREWRAESAAVSLLQGKARFWRVMGSSFSSILSAMCYVVVVIGGVYMVEARELTSGGLLAATMLSSRAMACFFSFSSLILRHKEFGQAMDELDRILPSPANEKEQMPQGRLRGDILFHNVSCQLGNRIVFNKLNLRIAAGETVGIVGYPGAGKTTLLRMACGVVKPRDGEVLIDNTPVHDLSEEDISDSIGYKPQELCLLGGTIENVVSAGRWPTLSAQQREIALQFSGLIMPFRNGELNWKTDTGTRGSKLSGGQRQMIALARAICSDPSILLFDEPTNGFDADSEQNLARQIARLKGQRTILVSSHCSTILSVCDRIIVVGKGGILADGPREKLFNAK